MRFPSFGLVTSLVASFSINAANAHPLLVLPAHHASVLAVKLASHVVPTSVHGTGIVSSQSLLNLLTKSKGSDSLSGLAISGSAKALLLQDKLVVQNGFGTGLSALANSEITNGALKGNGFILGAGSTYNPTGSNPFFLGNNPLNVGGATSPFPVAPSVAASFVDLSGKGSASSLISLLGKSTAHVSLASASSRAALARFKSLTESSYKAGANANDGVITNGQISGTFYDGFSGGTYFQTGKIVLALGNNPLNVNPTVFTSSNPASYLDFGKYQYNISSGLIFPTVYFNSEREGLIIAIGSNKLNSFPFGPSSVTETSLVSTLIGKLTLLKHL